MSQWMVSDDTVVLEVTSVDRIGGLVQLRDGSLAFLEEPLYATREEAERAVRGDDDVDTLACRLALALLRELPPDAVVQRYMSATYTAAQLIDELMRGTTQGTVWAGDFLRVCRDVLARSARRGA